MTMFGSHETIHTKSFEQAMAHKVTFRYGKEKNVINKAAESFHISEEADAVAKILAVIKSIKAGQTDFSCIELFADENKITRINICNMSLE